MLGGSGGKKAWALSPRSGRPGSREAEVTGPEPPGARDEPRSPPTAVRAPLRRGHRAPARWAGGTGQQEEAVPRKQRDTDRCFLVVVLKENVHWDVFFTTRQRVSWGKNSKKKIIRFLIA